MLKTCAEIARLKGSSRQAVQKFVSQNGVAPSGMKGKLKTYDCSKEPLLSYLRAAEKRPRPGAETASPYTAGAGEKAAGSGGGAKTGIPKPLNDLLKGRVPSGIAPSSAFYMKALKAAEDNGDAPLLFRLAQAAAKEDSDEAFQMQRIKTERANEQIAQEKAERLRIENEIRRGMYMEHAKVKLLFGKAYAAHTSVLMPLGLKLADMLDALPEGEERRGRIQGMIDAEVFSALETVKKLIESFVKNGGA